MPHPALEFVFGSIADEVILNSLPVELDYAFHLACYHGNQYAIHDPIADHDNNTHCGCVVARYVTAA